MEQKEKVQSYVSSEDGILFDVSINTDEISFKMLELTKEEITQLLKNIKAQVKNLSEEYQKLRDVKA